MNDAIRYKRNFLTEVIARLDFPSPLPDISGRLPRSISEAALRSYPIAEPQKAIARRLEVTPEAVSSKQTEFTEWRFFGKEREKALTITPDAVFVRYTAYESFEGLKADFLALVDVLFQEFDELVVSRLGLRYINNVSLPDGDPLDWNGLINPAMLSILDVYPDRDAVSRAFHNLEFNYGEFSLRAQYGLHNPDHPAPIRRRVFVLDFDAYEQGLLSREDILRGLHAFHAKIQGLFELSILPGLREILHANGR